MPLLFGISTEIFFFLVRMLSFFFLMPVPCVVKSMEPLPVSYDVILSSVSNTHVGASPLCLIFDWKHLNCYMLTSGLYHVPLAV